ncbi:MAG: sulfatase-like hydrolase/transferase [Nitrospirota bacterium]
MNDKRSSSLNRRERTRALWLFVAANVALSLWIASPYLEFGPLRGEWGAWAFTRVAFLSHFATLAILLGLVLWPLVALFSSRTVLLTAPPLLMFLYQFILILDVRIYALFRFHLNGLVLNTLTTEGSWDSVTLGRSTILTSVVVLAALALAEWAAMYAILRALVRRGGPARSRRWAPAIVAVFVLVVATDKLGFAYANFHDKLEVTRYQRLFPLYRTLLLDKSFEKYLGWKKPAAMPTAAIPGGGLLRYPLGDVVVDETGPPWNIVWIAVESWRSDTFNDELTPHVAAFGRRAKVFDRHFSGGNATRFGIFSLFYGLYGSYWHQFLAERRSPVFLDVLQQRNYEFLIASSTQLSYPEFRDTAFVKLPPEVINDRLPADSAVARDALMADKFDAFLADRKTDQPFFAFLFPDSPHAPYHFPPEFEQYRPVTDQINYALLKKGGDRAETTGLFNRYRNSVLYVDSIIGRMLDSLDKRGLLDRTIVVITGDHGQEFFETGYLGHNSTFSTYQSQVPLILYWPGVTPGRDSRLTSHVDIVPTMFALLGIKAAPKSYSQGISLVEGGIHPFVVVSGWDTLGLVDDRSTLVLSTESYNAGMIEVRLPPGYVLADDPRRILSERAPQLGELTRGLGEFLR